VGRPRRVGVSSFGVSGTNAHVILEEAPAPPGLVEPSQPTGATVAGASGGLLIWALSGRSAAAVRAQATRLLAAVDAQPELRPEDVAYSLLTSRTVFDRRAVVLAGDRAGLRNGLERLAAGTAGPDVISGRRVRGRLAVLFAGQGSQRAGMGRSLRAAVPAFAEAFETVSAALDRHLERPLSDALDDVDLLRRTEFTQPALFAFEVALYRLLALSGVRPNVLLGHSIGELAAAHVAHVWSLDDAARMVAARGRLMGALSPGGVMTAVRASVDEVEPLLTDRVSIAAVNGPSAVVLSGDVDAVEAVTAELAARGRRITPLRVSHAFHSHRMEPMLEEFRRVAASVTYHDPSIPVVSNITGRIAEPGLLTSPEYWVRHVREPVCFMAGIRSVHEHGVTTFLEAGPGGALSAMGQECIADSSADIAFVSASKPGTPETTALVTALARLFTRGAHADLGAVVPVGRRVDLPTYSFQHKHYWLEAATTMDDSTEYEEDTVAAARTGMQKQLAGLSPDDQRALLIDLVLAEATTAMRNQAIEVDLDAESPFLEIGFNSLSAVELRNRLVELTGVELTPMLLFDYPTPEYVSDLLRELLLA
ncbi:acyltransferase domain-containing protein, partial [Frankia sp. Mgl5]|uniref:acyltransferase domain-containing protein n=1 Tax=Frankia sp. Mgl5 TaxID=2933793 RepID=UPI00200F8830